MVLSEEWILGKLNERGHTLWIVKKNGAFRNKEHFLKFLSVGYDGFPRFVNSTIHANNQLVLESCICIQKEAVKHMKEIAAKNGYLMVFDANTTIIAADKINISNIVIDKLNKSLTKISIEKEN